MNIKMSPFGKGETYKTVLLAIKRQLPKIITMIILMIVVTSIGIVSPLLFKTLVDNAIPQKDMTKIIWLLIGMVALPISAAGLAAMQDYVRAHIGEEVSQSLRTGLFNHLVRVRLLDIEKMQPAEITYTITRSCGEIGQVYVTQQLLPLVSCIIVIVGTLSTMAILNWQLLLVTMLVFPPSYFLATRVGKRAKSLDHALHDVLVKGEGIVQETFNGLRSVRISNGEERETQKWSDWVSLHWSIKAKTLVFHNAAMTLPSEVLNNIALGVVFGFGAIEVISGRLSIGGLVAFIAYVPKVFSSLRVLLSAHINTEKIKVAAEKIDALFALQEEEQSGQTLFIHKNESPSVEFKNVSFDYGREGFDLRNVSFKVEPGEFVGIVGPSGSGKTTILDLIMRFYPPDCGTILINNVDITQFSISSLRHQIGYVSQDIFIWNDSITNNICYPVVDADTAKIAKAAEIANLHRFISALPESYQTVIGTRGSDMSGGERQRLAIARALMKEPKILLLDEATSALDAITEIEVRDAIQIANQGRTMFAVAHRLSTLQKADKFIVMDQGKIVEMGSKDNLLKFPGLFHSLYQAQKLDYHPN